MKLLMMELSGWNTKISFIISPTFRYVNGTNKWNIHSAGLKEVFAISRSILIQTVNTLSQSLKREKECSQEVLDISIAMQEWH